MPTTTVIRTATNTFAIDQELAFCERRGLPAEMRKGCRESILKQMGDDPFLVNLGLDEPVSVTQDHFIDGQVDQVVGIIVYSDAEFDAMFFVYRSRRENVGLAAVMGSSYDVSRCIDGYLDDERYYALCWDGEKRSEMFALPDCEVLYADDGIDGTFCGALVEGRMVSVGKMDTTEIDYDRLPELILQLHEVEAQAERIDQMLLMPESEAVAA